MPEVKLYLFGHPRLESDGQTMPIRRRKSVALLAYLALSEQGYSREHLSALLWPEHVQPSAHGNLRRELSRLRKELGEDFLSVEGQHVDMATRGAQWVDVRRFRQSLALVESHNHFPQTACKQCLAALQEMVALHTDSFMAGFTLPDSPAFDAWQHYVREDLLHALSKALQTLVDYHRMRQEYDETASYAQLLHEKLGAPPKGETVALYRAIQSRQFPAARNEGSTGEMLSLAMEPALRFALRDQMSSGGQGALFRGLDRISGEEVVIKQLRPEQLNNPDHVARFVREGEMLRRLNHPNIVRVLATYDYDGKHCLVMEYMAGGSLHDLLLAEGVLPVKRALEIGVELADALSRAHHLGIIHRDVKPSNVLMAADGTPRLSDFGLARLRQQRLDLTPTGALLGSPFYMSPEALRGEELDERSDIWSFGALLFEMISGQPPFPGKQMAQIMMSILNDSVPSLDDLCPGISPALAALLRRMLTKDREARIYSMRLIAAGLEALRDERTELADLRLEVGTESERRRTADVARQAGSQGARTPMRSAALEPRSASVEDSLFVGRHTELEALMGQLEHALAGRPQAAFIVGEAGAGKTTLMQTFARVAQAEVPELLVAGGEGNAFSGSGDPFLPFREILEMLTGDVHAPSAYGQLSPYDSQRLQTAAPLVMQALLEEGPELVRTMLSPGRLLERMTDNGASSAAENRWTSQLKALAEQWSLQQSLSGPSPDTLFEQYARVLQRLSAERPLLLLLDDLQWVDDASANLLLHLGKRVRGARLLLVGAYRPGDLARRGEEGRQVLQWAIGELKRDLNPLLVDLSRAEGRDFVDDLLDAYPNRLDAEFRETLFKLTRGNPLFTIELLRGMQERGDLTQDDNGRWHVSAALDWQTLPERVEGAIGERLSRLDAPLLEALQVASVEGEEFTAEVVANVLGMPPRELVSLLSRRLDRQHRMVRSLGIVRSGERRLSRYGFRHNLIQRYLYNSLDEVERVYQHEAVGRALAELYGDQAGSVAMELALHFEQAALTPETVSYLKLAAREAMRRGAFGEALRRLERALTLLTTLPEGKVHDELELAVQLLQATTLVMLHGVAIPEAETAYLRALQLSEQLNDTTRLSKALFGLAAMREFQGRYAESQALLERRLKLPDAAGDAVLNVESRELLACSTFHQGMFEDALAHARLGLNLYEPQAQSAFVPVHGRALLPACQTWEAHALWFLGYADQSMAAMTQALATARALRHEFSVSLSLVQTAFLHQFRGEPQQARTTAAEALTIATAQNYTYRESEARVLLGWAEAMQATGDAQALTEALARLQQGLQEVIALGGCLDVPYFRGLLAEALAAAGRQAEALQVVELALMGENGQERAPFFWDAELSRMQAALLLALGGAGSAQIAEICLQRALQLAQRQDARILGLRAAVDLAQLWQKQGRQEEARTLVKQHYDWFREGFETPDLRRAATLL